jgi:hypothetical protein
VTKMLSPPVSEARGRLRISFGSTIQPLVTKTGRHQIGPKLELNFGTLRVSRGFLTGARQLQARPAFFRETRCVSFLQSALGPTASRSASARSQGASASSGRGLEGG